MPFSLLLVGYGKMGGALLARWREQKPAGIEQYFAVSRKPGHDLASLPEDFRPDIIVFAVKPQQLETVLPKHAARFGTAPLYLSVAAGKTLDFYEKHLSRGVRIIRAMPNTPALIGQGMTVLVANHHATAADKQLATELMQAAGQAEWLADEALMDAATALSGCGPAYVFLFLESMAEAGVSLGLPDALAKSLAIQTVTGSAALAAAKEAGFAQLREQVASRGGSTEAALAVLTEEGALKTLVARAMRSAERRAKELAE